MSGRIRRLWLMLALSALVPAGAVGTVALLYRQVFEQERVRLVATARSAVRLIDALDEADPSVKDETDIESVHDRLSRLFRSTISHRLLGETGKIELGRREGNVVIILAASREVSEVDPLPRSLPIGSPIGEPIQRAVRGESGTVVGLDSFGILVLAAFEGSAEGGLGVVAKVAVAEIREPFLRAGWMVGAFIALILIGGMVVLWQITEPLIGSLEESQRRYRSLFESIADPVVLLDPFNRRFHEVNDPAERYLGYTREELRQLPLSVADAANVDASESAREEAMRTGRALRFDTQHRIRSGELRDVRVSTVRVLIEEKLYLLEVWSDVTEFRRLERALRRSRDELEDRVHQRTAELAASMQRLEAEVAERRHMEQSLHALSRRLLDLQDREWRRIANELHDEFAQLLVAAQLGVQRLFDELPAERAELRDVGRRVLDNLAAVIAATRTMLQSLHPTVLDTLGLVPALEALVQDFKRNTGIVCRLSVDGTPVGMTAESQLAVYRIVQEALQNVTRHAAAAHVDVAMNVTPERLRVAVRDDGKGMDPDSQRVSLSYGLTSMRERAAHCGGTLTVRSGSAAGTTVTVEVPLAASAAEGTRATPDGRA